MNHLTVVYTGKHAQNPLCPDLNKRDYSISEKVATNAYLTRQVLIFY